VAGLPTPVPVDPVVTLVIFCIGASAAIVVLALM
jgi:hypothetical protein